MIARSCGTTVTCCPAVPADAAADLCALGTRALEAVPPSWATAFRSAAGASADCADCMVASPPPQADANNTIPASVTARREPYRNLLMPLLTATARAGFGGRHHDGVTFSGAPGLRGSGVAGRATGQGGRYGQESWKATGAMWWSSAAGSRGWPPRGTCARAEETSG
ncbi:hypothetical protein GCM10023075_29810 [Streptosporangium album]